MPKEVRNVQGTEEFVRAIENFEKLSIRVFESQLYNVRCVFVSLEREPTVSAVDGFFLLVTPIWGLTLGLLSKFTFSRFFQNFIFKKFVRNANN